MHKNKSETQEIDLSIHTDDFYKKFKKGVQLPYDILDIHNIPDGAQPGNFIEIRCGGFGSEISPHPTEKKQFYVLTDRGPNTTYDINGDKGKIFLDPNYVPKIGLFELLEDGTIQKIKEITLKDPTGRNITGLPNLNFGASKEVAYDQFGKVLSNGTDEFGLDSEGLVAMRDGSFWVSDEYGPHIVHFNAEGVEIDRINAYVGDARRKSNYLLPAEFANRRQNRGMEGLTVSPDQKILYGIMQSTMSNPDVSVTESDLTRIVAIHLEHGEIAQYLYQQESGKKVHSNTAIVALNEHSFIVAERDDDFYQDNKNAFKRVYKIDIDQATNLENVLENGVLKQDEKVGLTIHNQTLEQYVLQHGWDGLLKHGIQPVSKQMVVDLIKELEYPHDKVEGLWVMDHSHLAVLNDDDYGFTENAGVLEQKYLDQDKKKIDANTLYILSGLDLKPIDH